MSIHPLIKTRLNPERAMVLIELRIPADVLESMQRIAPQKDMSDYQALVKSYISDGLRRDEAEFVFKGNTNP